MAKTNKNNTIPFVKYYTGLSYLFSPAETRFIAHMVDIEYKKSCGYVMNLTRQDYMRIMGLNEHSFDKCIRRLVQLDLLEKTSNAKGNRVYYSFNMKRYETLVGILSCSCHADRLIAFCKKHFIEDARPIDSITEEEIANLKAGNACH